MFDVIVMKFSGDWTSTELRKKFKKTRILSSPKTFRIFGEKEEIQTLVMVRAGP